jgi:predicted transcriptional regulator
MNDLNIISLIFLSIAIGSQHEPIKFNEISMIADGINHSVPNEKEINQSISYLLKIDLINKNAKRYLLSEKGKLLHTKSQNDNNNLLSIWKNLESQI